MNTRGKPVAINMSCIFLITDLHKIFTVITLFLCGEITFYVYFHYTCIFKQERKCTYKRNTEAYFRNLCCRGKAISITHSECVSVALVIQHAKSMRRIILSYVARPSLLCFCTLFHNRYDFRKIVMESNVFWFSTFFFWNICHSKKIWARYHKCTYVYMYSTRYLCQILMKLEFSRQILKKNNTQMPNLIKSF